jgi:PBP1b-binding outer membrane lipoprotein LpoB
MKKAVLLLLAAIILAGCQGSPADTEGYVRNHEPKTGRPDL